MSAMKSRGGAGHRRSSGDHFDLELDEAEVWGVMDAVITPELATRPVSGQRRQLRTPVRKGVREDERLPVGPRSLPVEIPDWSKILRGEYRERVVEYSTDDYDEEEGEEDEGDRMPPHEYLARTRVASLSVHEGVGRTLKGRDLSRVRDAIWKQTGFEA